MCGRWSDWSEVTVQGPPGRVDPPTIEPKHYPCARLVRLTEGLPGEVQVYADQNLIGTGEGKFIPVLPHLRAGQVLTATRTIGGVTSNPSSPVTVSSAPERISAPSLHAAYGGSLSFTRLIVLTGLLPGAWVSVYSKNLLVDAFEATGMTVDRMLTFRPWPGTSIYARQSVCGQLSNDSNKVEAHGLLGITGPNGFNEFGDWPDYNVVNGPHTLNVSVTSYGEMKVLSPWSPYEKCPAFINLDVKLTSSDPTTVKVLGTGTSIIAAGQYSTDFQIELLKPGTATLTATADHYDSCAADVSVLGGAWFEDAAGHTYARWLTVEVGESLNLKAFAKPVPSDRKIQLKTSTNTDSVVSVPKELDIPQGQGSVSFTVTGKSAGFDTIRNVAWYYWDIDNVSLGRVPEVSIEVKAKPTPPPTKQTALVTLSCRIGPYPKPGQKMSNGTVKWTLTPQNIPAGQPGINKAVSFIQPWEQFPTLVSAGKYYIFVDSGGPYDPTLGNLAVGTWQVGAATPLWSASCLATLQVGPNTIHFQEFRPGCVVNDPYRYPGD